MTETTRFVDTTTPPNRPSTLQLTSKTPLFETEEHPLCPGCGHPVSWRALMEVITDLDIQNRCVGVVGHGCYTNIIATAQLEFIQCLHGRAPSVATGVRRMLPDAVVFTLQGDGDLSSEGLQEAIHTAARGESITCIMVNNGVFGDTGGHMTAATPLGQRTKTSLDGRDPSEHGYPIPVGQLLAQLEGTAYVARGSVHNAASVAVTRRLLKRAFELQMAGAGFTFVEILTMCPTGWFVPARDGGAYLDDALLGDHSLGELKAPA